jgi:predicted RNA-binding protein with PIN domain
MKKAPVLIVDGHSMIFQWPDLARQHARQPGSAREALIKMLRAFQDNSDWHIVVVFDGKGASAGEIREPHSIQVFYSKSGQTADSIIERLVARYASEYDVTVATDDGLERTTVQSFGANAMSSLQLRDDMQTADKALEDRLRQLRRR